MLESLIAMSPDISNQTDFAKIDYLILSNLLSTNTNLRSEKYTASCTHWHVQRARRASVKEKIQYMSNPPDFVLFATDVCMACIPNHPRASFLISTKIPRHSLAKLFEFLVRYRLHDV